MQKMKNENKENLRSEQFKAIKLLFILFLGCCFNDNNNNDDDDEFVKYFFFFVK